MKMSEKLLEQPVKAGDGYFRLQIRLHPTLYAQLRELTYQGGEHLDGRVYGGITRIVILALREYLEKHKATALKPEDLI
jgi:hypothetical protein